ATTALLPGRGTRCSPARQDLLLSRTVISRREVALRGPFRLRLASACQVGPPAAMAARGARPAQPRTRARAMHEPEVPSGEMSGGTLAANLLVAHAIPS